MKQPAQNKAGGKVTLLLIVLNINSQAEEIAVLPYEGGNADLGDTKSANALGSIRNTWTIPFWTIAKLDEVPNGTVVHLNLSATGTEGGSTTFLIPPYADGVVRTEGSIYEDWFVVIQGSEK